MYLTLCSRNWAHRFIPACTYLIPEVVENTRALALTPFGHLTSDGLGQEGVGIDDPPGIVSGQIPHVRKIQFKLKVRSPIFGLFLRPNHEL